jgi:hypothetical protein
VYPELTDWGAARASCFGVEAAGKKGSGDKLALEHWLLGAGGGKGGVMPGLVPAIHGVLRNESLGVSYAAGEPAFVTGRGDVGLIAEAALRRWPGQARPGQPGLRRTGRTDRRARTPTTTACRKSETWLNLPDEQSCASLSLGRNLSSPRPLAPRKRIEKISSENPA